MWERSYWFHGLCPFRGRAVARSLESLQSCDRTFLSCLFHDDNSPVHILLTIINNKRRNTFWMNALPRSTFGTTPLFYCSPEFITLLVLAVNKHFWHLLNDIFFLLVEHHLKESPPLFFLQPAHFPRPSFFFPQKKKSFIFTCNCVFGTLNIMLPWKHNKTLVQHAS